MWNYLLKAPFPTVKRSVAAMLLLALPSCKPASSAQFSGGPAGSPVSSFPASSVSQANLVPQPQAPVQVAPANTAPELSCGAAGLTRALLLTPTVQNAKPGNYLEYQLSVNDCNGNPLPLTADKILFDINVNINGSGAKAPLYYTVKANDNAVSGILQNVKGSDLFGRTGANFFHFETDKPVILATKENAVILHIELGGQLMVPLPDASGNVSPNQLTTYLRFGNASPVHQIVTLLQ